MVKPKQTFVESMNLTESNCEGDMNGVIFHKNGEIGEAAKREKAKGENFLALRHRHILAFSVQISLQEVVHACGYGLVWEVFPRSNQQPVVRC